MLNPVAKTTKTIRGKDIFKSQEIQSKKAKTKMKVQERVLVLESIPVI